MALLNQLDAETPTLRLRRNHDVLQPGVNETIPQDVREADKVPVVPCDDPPKAVSRDLLDPVPFRLLEEARCERFSVQRVYLGVLERAAPVVSDRHRARRYRHDYQTR